MTNRELLELAAKAAGIQYHSYVDSELVGQGINIGDVDVPLWNPLTDDGDALRLAGKLNLLVGVAKCWTDGDQLRGVMYGEDPLPDTYAATRRAIVRAASEIGRAARNQTNTKD